MNIKLIIYGIARPKIKTLLRAKILFMVYLWPLALILRRRTVCDWLIQIYVKKFN
jgi:hypothetical protein